MDFLNNGANSFMKSVLEVLPEEASIELGFEEEEKVGVLENFGKRTSTNGLCKSMAAGTRGEFLKMSGVLIGSEGMGSFPQ